MLVCLCSQQLQIQQQQEQPRCTRKKGRQPDWSVHAVEYGAALKRKQLPEQAAVWTNLKYIMCSEISRAQRRVLCQRTWERSLEELKSQRQKVEWCLGDQELRSSMVVKGACSLARICDLYTLRSGHGAFMLLFVCLYLQYWLCQASAVALSHTPVPSLFYFETDLQIVQAGLSLPSSSDPSHALPHPASMYFTTV